MRPNMLRCWLQTLGPPVVACLGLVALVSAPAPAVSEEDKNYVLTFTCGQAFVMFPDGVVLEEDFSFDELEMRVGAGDESLHAAACIGNFDDEAVVHGLREMLGGPFGFDRIVESEKSFAFEAFGRPSLDVRGVMSFTEDGAKVFKGFRASITRPDENRDLVLFSLESDSVDSFGFHLFGKVEATAAPNRGAPDPEPDDHSTGDTASGDAL